MNIRRYLYHKREAFKRAVARRRDGYCNVLLYHRINDLSYDPQQLCVSAKTFEEQMRFLKSTHRFLAIDEFCEILSTKKKFPKNSLLITFDDGYADNYENALPVLEKLNLQAVFYISTGTLNSDQLFWWDELDTVFRDLPDTKQLKELLAKYKLESAKQLYNFYLKECKLASSLSVRNSLMSEVRTLKVLTDNEKKIHRTMTHGELKKFSDSKSVVIGAHTVNHLALGCLTESDQLYEILESVNVLSALIGKTVSHFSFPYGEKIHYTETTIRLCRELKLKSAAANYYDYVKPNDDIHSFPRVVVRDISAGELKQQLLDLAS